MRSPSSTSITLILRHGTILTMDPQRPRAEAVAIAGERIAAVGREEEIADLRGPNIREIDMQGGMLIPGFIDSHLHLVAGGRSLMELRLQNLGSPDELITLLKKAARERDQGDWIIGHGWEDAAVGGHTPDRQMLDAITSIHPIFLTRRDGHALWLNTAAIRLLRIDRMRPAAAREIPRDANGFPIGVIYEDSVTRATQRLRTALPRSYLKRAVLVALKGLAASGVTTAHDIATTYPRDFLMYRHLAKEGLLSTRIISSPHGSDRYSTLSFSLLRALNDPMLRVGPRKYFLDGSFGAKTALLYEPYADDPSGTNVGMCILMDRELRAIFRRSYARREPIALHAIGDRAVDLAVFAAEQARTRYGPRDVRNRIEHLQIVSPDIIPRFRDAGLIASFQPNFLYELEMTRSRLGAGRLGRCYLLRAFWDAGVPVILSSDWPYGGGDYPRKADGAQYQSFEPLLGIHAAVDRLGFDRAQALTVIEALTAYTRNAAWAHYEEADKGVISPGKLADLVLLSQDITAIPTPEILNTRIMMTIVGGRIVYEA